MEAVFQNALPRLIFWFLLGALVAILLIKVIKSHSNTESQRKAMLMIVRAGPPGS
jgi:hypothetical protein